MNVPAAGWVVNRWLHNRMRILLATYNFYPYNFGGSEVYVHALAQHIKKEGNEPVVIAAVPDAAFEQHNTLFRDGNLQVCSYRHNDITVLGVRISNTTALHNYGKEVPQHQPSWNTFFSQQPNFDILHMQALTAGVGLNLLNGFAKNNRHAKIISSFHTAITCPKGTLAFARTYRECTVAAAAHICTACMITTHTGLPMPVSKGVASLLPLTDRTELPNALQLKRFVAASVNAFRKWDALTHQWMVYSQGLRQNLIRNGVPEEKIAVLRHGISERYKPREQQATEVPQVFLYSGRFYKLKGIYTLLQAWLQLPQLPGRELWLTGHTGDGETGVQPLLQALSQRSDVKLLGALPSEQMPALYQKVHCVLVPSECVEIGPLVFHEAVASGCHIIASDIGGCKELSLFYPKQSTLFETGNPQSLATAISSFSYKPITETRVAPVNFDTHFSKVTQLYRRTKEQVAKEASDA